MSKRKPLPKYMTPVGTAKYPHLNTPDTRFDDEGVYKCDLIVPADEAADLIARLEKIRDDFFETLDPKKQKTFSKAAVCEDELDDAGDETGNVVFRTKLNAIGRSKATGEQWTNEPKLFDSNRKPMAKDAQIWSGSQLIVAGKVMPYAMASTKTVGVSLKCEGVQVVKLVSGGEQTADSFGFGTVEGGFESDAGSFDFPSSDGADEDSADLGDDEDF